MLGAFAAILLLAVSGVMRLVRKRIER